MRLQRLMERRLGKLGRVTTMVACQSGSVVGVGVEAGRLLFAAGAAGLGVVYQGAMPWA